MIRFPGISLLPFFMFFGRFSSKTVDFGVKAAIFHYFCIGVFLL